jgi:DNA-binding transcriptional regulator YiaG
MGSRIGALIKTLREQREMLHEVFAEVLEDVALAEAIWEGQRTRQPARASSGF